MKTFCTFLGLLLLAGCGEDTGGLTGRRAVYPALDESPPPPAPASPPGETPAAMKPDTPTVEVVEDSWMQRQLQMAEQIKRMREYAAQASPGDPAAMTEKEIEAFSKRGDPVIY